jgi:endonuclease/exonuclease/phosphatase family metal-dependent hydrolase
MSSFGLTTFNLLSRAVEHRITRAYAARWRDRKVCLEQQLTQHTQFTDIICVQELDKDLHSWFLQTLGKSYAMTAQVKRYKIAPGVYHDDADGCATAWDTNVFKLIKDHVFFLDDTPGQSPVVIVNTLLHRGSQKLITIINTHLSSGYGEQEALRVQQMVRILAVTIETWTAGKCIFVGDMNSDANELYGRQDNVNSLAHLMQVKHSFHNAFLGVVNENHRLITYNDHQPSWFDQIWVTQDLTVMRTAIQPLAADKTNPPIRLPEASKGCGSDHLPLYAVIMI